MWCAKDNPLCAAANAKPLGSPAGNIPAPNVPEKADTPTVLEIPAQLDVAAELRGVCYKKSLMKLSSRFEQAEDTLQRPRALHSPCTKDACMQQALESAAADMRHQLQDPTVWPQGHDEDMPPPPPPPPLAPHPSTIKVNMVAPPEPEARWKQSADKSGPTGVVEPGVGVVEMEVLDTVYDQPSTSDSQPIMTLLGSKNEESAGDAQAASSGALGQSHAAAHADVVQQSEPVASRVEELAVADQDAALLQKEAAAGMLEGSSIEPTRMTLKLGEIGSTVLKDPSLVNAQPHTAAGNGNATAVRGLQVDFRSAGGSPPPPPDRSGPAEVSSLAIEAPEQGKEPSSPVGPRIGSPDWSSLGSLVGPNDRGLLDTPLSRLQQPAGQLSLLLPGAFWQRPADTPTLL